MAEPSMQILDWPKFHPSCPAVNHVGIWGFLGSDSNALTSHHHRNSFSHKQAKRLTRTGYIKLDKKNMRESTPLGPNLQEIQMLTTNSS